jgi:lipoprotein NlpI
MKRVALAGLIIAALIGSAAATGYSDLDIGLNAHNLANNPRAIDYLSRAIGAPDLPANLLATAHLARGEVYHNTKNYDSAIADYTTALRLKPDLFQAYFMRHLAYLEKGDNEHALADLSKAINLRPWQKLPYVSRALVYASQEKYHDAITDLSRAIALETDGAPPYILRGAMYRSLNQLDGALADESQAILLDGKVATAYFERGATYQQQGDVSRAVADFTAGLAMSPSEGDARLRLGMTQWEAGDDKVALTNLILAVRQQPQNAYAVLWLAIAHRQNKSAYDKLRVDAAQLDKAKWPAPLIAHYLGSKSADEVFAAAVAPDARTAADQLCEARFYVGEWALLKGDPETARILLRAAAARCRPDFVERVAATYALKRMQ